jgi:HK97 family phage portal protein
MSTHQQRITGPIVPPPGASRASSPAIKNSTPITEYTQGSQAWQDLFGAVTPLPIPTERTALTVSAIYACINLIAGAVAAMPVNIYKINVDDGERDRLFNDDLHWVLNEEMTARWPASAGWEFLTKSVLFEGDGFAIIKRDRASRPIGLEPVHPFRVQVFVLQDGSRLVYQIAPEFINGQTIGKMQILDQDDVLHIPGFGFDGCRGLSPLRFALRQVGAIALATQDYAGNFFANSARPDYALATDQNLAEPKIKELQGLIDERHRSAANSHRPMLLHSGLKIQTWSLSANEMQLLQTRQFEIEEIARIYGVPAVMIGHSQATTAWGSGIESLGKYFVRYTLSQHLNKFEVEINRKLFRTATRGAEFDTTNLERADYAAMTTALRATVGRAGEPRIMSVNEARAVLRLKKDPGGGDELGVNAGTAPPDATPDPAKDAKP